MYSSVGERIYLRAPAAPLLWATTGGVSKSLPDFCRSQLCTVVHGHALCNGVPVQQRASTRLGCRWIRPMTKSQDRDAIYVKRQFDTEIIVLCVRWYITYP